MWYTVPPPFDKYPSDSLLVIGMIYKVLDESWSICSIHLSKFDLEAVCSVCVHLVCEQALPFLSIRVAKPRVPSTPPPPPPRRSHSTTCIQYSCELTSQHETVSAWRLVHSCSVRVVCFRKYSGRTDVHF